MIATLLALSTGVLAAPGAAGNTRVDAYVKHPGTPITFRLQIRTRENPEDEWVYLEKLKYFPRRLLTNPTGRKVSITRPNSSQLKRYTQVCAIHEPVVPKDLESGMNSFFAIRSCANYPDPDN